jgi:TolB-like protein
LKFNAPVQGRFYIEDDRGVRAADLNKASGTAFSMVLDLRRRYFLRRVGTQAAKQAAADIAPGKKRLMVAALSFKRAKMAARSGSLDRTFRKDLYRVAFTRGFYDGFCAQTGHQTVSASSGGAAASAQFAAAGPQAAGVAAGQAAGKKTAGPRWMLPRVAVLYFDYDGPDKNLAVLKKGLAEMLITDLSQIRDINVVERLRLEDVLKELKLQRSKKIDRRTAVKVGKLLGAKYLIFGGYLNVLGTFCINTRVAFVERGVNLPSAKACGKPDDFLKIYKQVSRKLIRAMQANLEPDLLKTRRRGKTRKPKRARRPTRGRLAKAKIIKPDVPARG